MDDSKNISSEAVHHVVETSDYENDSHIEHNDNLSEQGHASQSYRLLNIICFWMVGLCNGFGWTVMLSATYDILEQFDGVSV